MPKTKPETVHLYPVPGVSTYPYPSVEFDATSEEAEALLAFIPAPFTTTPQEAEKRPETGDTP